MFCDTISVTETEINKDLCINNIVRLGGDEVKMNEKSMDLLGSIANNTDSILIAFFIVLIVALIPLYVFILNNRKHSAKVESERLKAENERSERYMEREKRIIEVVTNNTVVMSKMAVTLEHDGKDTIGSLTRVHERIDTQNSLIMSQSDILSKFSSLLAECVSNQSSMKNDIRTIMLKSNEGRYTGEDQRAEI